MSDTISFFSSLTKVVHNFYPTILDASLSFVYNYKPANFKEDFISALTALVTAQDDPQRLKELTVGAKNILNDYTEELPNVLRLVNLIFSHLLIDYSNSLANVVRTKIML